MSSRLSVIDRRPTREGW